MVFFGWLIWTVAASTSQERAGQARLLLQAATCLVVSGCGLSLVDPLRHILLDHGGVFFEESSLSMYNDSGGLTAIGKACQVCTIVGLSSLVCGIMLSSSFFKRLFTQA